MNRYNKPMRKFVFLFLVFAITVPVFASAAINLNLSYPEFGNVTFDKKQCEDIIKELRAGRTPDKLCGQQLGGLIAWLYYFIIGIAGLAAFVMLVWGGIQWLTSGAIPSQAGEARDKLKSAVLGLLLILASFLIIQIINPQLTILSQEGLGELAGIVPTLPKQGSQACGAPNVCVPTGTCTGAVTGASCSEVTEPSDVCCDAGTPGGTPIVMLTVNGQASIIIPPDPVTNTADVTLEWTVSGASTCQAQAIPSHATWTGSKSGNGTFSETAVFPIGFHNIILVCNNTQDNVTVDVGTGVPGLPITVDLKARDRNAPQGSGSDGPLEFHINDLSQSDFPSGFISLDWTSSNATFCNTSGGIDGQFTELNEPPNGTSSDFILNAGNHGVTYTYRIECFAPGTPSEVDTVQVEWFD